MSAFKNIVANLYVSFNLKNLHKIKEEQKRIISIVNEKKRLNTIIIGQLEEIDSLSQQLIESNKTIINQLEIINSKQTEIKELLSKKDINAQNRWAQKNGNKSAIQYKVSLNIKYHNNLVEIEQKKLELNQYEANIEQLQIKKQKKIEELETNKKELEFHNDKLKKIENALNFYKSIRYMTFCNFISAILFSVSFILLNFYKNNGTILIAACGISWLLISVLSYLGYKKDVNLSKTLSLGRPNFFIFCHGFFASSTILCLSFKNNIADCLSLIFFTLIIVLNLYNTYTVAISNEKNKAVFSPLDFICFNLPILSIIALYTMYFNIPNQIINYIASGFFALSCLMILISFFWNFKNQTDKVRRDLNFCLGIVINIVFICLLLVIVIVNVISSVEISATAISWIGIILPILISIFSPIFKSLFKPTVKDPLKEDKEQENSK